MGETVWGAYLFSKLVKWRSGEGIKFEAETIMWHDDWFMNLIGKESEGIAVIRRELGYYRLVLYQSPPTPFPTPPLLWSVSNTALTRP